MSVVKSESVWFEQVDTALLNYIKGIVKLPDSFGNPSTIPVKIRKPDEDFKVEEYPCITVYNLYNSRDEFRYYSDTVIVEKDIERGKFIQEKGAIPYNLFYQIDFWSKSQSQMNEMTRLWLGYHPDKCFNLPVKDVSGNDRDCFVLLSEDLKKSDLLTSNNRTFHSFITYRIWVEIDERIRTEGDLVTEIIIK